MTNNGYGMVRQAVMRNPDLSPTSKCIYAYLASLAGSEGSCYPSIKTMTQELAINKDTVTKYLAELERHGIISRENVRQGGKFGATVYRMSPCPIISGTVTSDMVISDIKNIKLKKYHSLSLKNDSEKIPFEGVLNLYNGICVSLPKASRLSDSRKRLIRARFGDGWTTAEFKRLFETAQASDFLTGCNKRGWRANFDWLLNSTNAVKVMDGNYNNREKINERKNDFKYDSPSSFVL